MKSNIYNNIMNSHIIEKIVVLASIFDININSYKIVSNEVHLYSSNNYIGKIYIDNSCKNSTYNFEINTKIGKIFGNYLDYKKLFIYNINSKDKSFYDYITVNNYIIDDYSNKNPYKNIFVNMTFYKDNKEILVLNINNGNLFIVDKINNKEFDIVCTNNSLNIKFLNNSIKEYDINVKETIINNMSFVTYSSLFKGYKPMSFNEINYVNNDFTFIDQVNIDVILKQIYNCNRDSIDYVKNIIKILRINNISLYDNYANLCFKDNDNMNKLSLSNKVYNNIDDNYLLKYFKKKRGI